MWALDTNTVSYFLKGRGKVAERLLAAAPAEIGLPAIVVLELDYGARRSEASPRLREQLETLLDGVLVLPFGLAEARAAAGIRADLERRGQPIGAHDLLIAATAVATRCTLVTHNVREFRRVKGLQVEDWF